MLQRYSLAKQNYVKPRVCCVFLKIVFPFIVSEKYFTRNHINNSSSSSTIHNNNDNNNHDGDNDDDGDNNNNNADNNSN